MPVDYLPIEVPEFWMDLGLGSVITLQDPQAVEDMIRRGQGAFAQQCEVDKIFRIREREGLAEWHMFHLNEPTQELWLMAKIVGRNMDLRVYYQPPEDQFMPGNRRQLVERGDAWLFHEPARGFHWNDLEYFPEITQNLQLGDGSVVRVPYHLKPQGVLHGSVRITPEEYGIRNPLLTTIAEYRCAFPQPSAAEYHPDIPVIENPELLILEIGDDEEGGRITLSLGADISPNYLGVMKRSQR